MTINNSELLPSDVPQQQAISPEAANALSSANCDHTEQFETSGMIPSEPMWTRHIDSRLKKPCG